MAKLKKDSDESSNETIKTFEEKKRSEKDGKRGDILSRIFAVLCAMVVWFYVVGVDSPVFERSFTDMVVDITNENIMLKNYGYSVLSGYDNKVSLVLSGKKSDINRLKSTDIDVYIDASKIAHSGEQSLPVMVDIGSDINVVSVSPENVLLYVDKTTTVNIPVTPVIGTSVLPAGLEVDDPICTPATVSVTGSEEILKSIKQARVNINLGTVTQSLVVRQGITFIDKDGAEIDSRYITTNVSIVSVDIPVYTQKQIPLKVAYKNGYFNDTNSKISITPSTIAVRGVPQCWII
ncbi:MAG: YbbR-like domain-containing protein [Eubacteriales bacterium]